MGTFIGYDGILLWLAAALMLLALGLAGALLTATRSGGRPWQPSTPHRETRRTP